MSVPISPLEKNNSDLNLFDRIAPAYHKKDQIPYCREARRLRLKQTLKHIPKPIPSVMEAGCGAGYTADYLAGDYQNYLGLDYSQKLIDIARKRNRGNHIRFLCMDTRDFNGHEKFQLILMIGVLHHIPNAEAVLRHLKSFLAPNGRIVVNEPQRGNPVIGLGRWLRKKVDPNYSSDQVTFSRNELESLFHRSGFETRIFPQGIFSTPLAETCWLPRWAGSAYMRTFGSLDPILEPVIDFPVLRNLTWNVVVEAKPIESQTDSTA